MPLPRLIPCLDVADGRVVKGVNFENLRDVGDPVELGAAYSDAGADELVFLDITATLWLDASAAKPPPPGRQTAPPSAALDKRAAAVATAARVAEQVTIPFTFGGGIRSVDDACAVLEAGADKVSVNSAALARPELITELADVLGSQAVVVAIDTENARVRSHAATRDAARDTVEWAKECEARGAGELLVTSIDRDGTREGYDLAQLQAIGDAVSLPVIASGGAGNAQHVKEALDVASAALLASILHEDPERLVELRGELKELGVSLR
jgi:cyclase